MITGTWTNNTAFDYVIPLSDMWNSATNATTTDASGIKSATLNIDGSTKQMNLGTDSYNPSSSGYGNGTYYNYNSTVAFTEGEHTVTLSLEDYAGNTAANVVTYTHKIDKTAPTIGDLSVSKELITQAIIEAINDTNPFTLTVNITDLKTGVASVSGIKSVELKDGSTVLTKDTDYTVTEPSGGNGTYTFKIKKAKLTTGTHSFTVEATDNADNVGVSTSKEVKVDIEPPTITFNGYSPYVEVKESGSTVTKVNGTVKITGTALDETKLDETNAVSLKFYKETSSGVFDTNILTVTGISEEDITKGATGSFVSWSFDIPTTLLTAMNTPESVVGKFKIVITAQDAVKNTATEEVVLYVDQNTDKPVVECNNANTTVTADNISNGNNLFSTTGNNKMSFSVSDDDGLAKYTMNVSKKNGSNYETVTSAGKTETITGISKTISYTLPSVEGIYKVEFTAYDNGYDFANEGNTNNQYHKSSVMTYYVGVDGGAPSLAVSTGSGSFMAKERSFTVTGTVKDSSGSVTMYRYKTIESAQKRESGEDDKISTITADDEEKTWTVNNTGDEKTWSDEYTAAAVGIEGRTVYYVAVDKYKQATITTFSYKIDDKAPTVAPNWLTDNGISAGGTKTLDWTNSSVYTYTIPLSDAWDTANGKKLVDNGGQNQYSGIATAKLILAGTPPKEYAMTQGSSYGADYESTYTNYTSTVAFEDGTHTVALNVTDASGNPATSLVAYTHNIDTKAPDISLGSYGDKINGTNKGSYTTGGVYTIPLTINDAVAGIATSGINADSIKVTLNNELTKIASGTPTTAQYTVSVSENVYTFTFNEGILETGEHKIVFEVSDNAGNKSTITAPISVDVTAPTITYNGYAPYVDVEEGGSTVKKVNGTITISGNVNDETKLDETQAVTLVIKDGGAVVTPSTILPITANGTYKAWSFTLDTTELTDKKEYDVILTAKDAVGNEDIYKEDAGESYSFKLVVDQSTDTPEITGQNFLTTVTTSAGVNATTNLFGTTSNHALTGTVTDDDGVATIYVGHRKAGTTGAFENIGTANVSGGKLTSQSFRYEDLPTDQEGRYEIKVIAEDTKNETGDLSKKEITFFVGVSSGAPTISIDTAQNQWVKDTLSVSGTVSANANSVMVGTENVTTYTSGGTTYQDTVTATGSSGDSVELTYTATNEFDQTGSAKLSYKIDKTVPVIKNDDTNKLVIGKVEIPTGTEWHNNTALKFEGYYTDAHSGVSEIKYTITHGSTTSDESSITASRVSDGLYRFTATIDGFAVGQNTLKFKAVDNVGNESAENVRTVQIDDVAPVITFENNTILTRSVSGSAAITLTGTITDNDGGSGVDTSEVKFTVNNKVITTTESDEGKVVIDGNNVTLTIKPDAIFAANSTDANVGIFATAKDNAGNANSNMRISSLTVDNTPPTVAFDENAPVSPVSDADSDSNTKERINKTITLKGSSSDNNEIASVNITYKTADTISDFASATATNVISEPFTGSVCYNWTTTFDTTKAGLGKYIQFFATATDKAGNTQTTPNDKYIYKIDQSSDRPIITFTGLDDANSWLKSVNLTGSLSDDDGTITSMKIAFMTGETSPATEDWKTVEVKGGNWSYRLNEIADGELTLYFKVRDKVGTTFDSATDLYPVFKYAGTGATEIKDKKTITIKKDLNSPVIGEGYANVTNSGTPASTPTDISTQISSNLSVGGNKKYIQVAVIISDAFMTQAGSGTVTLDILNSGNTSELATGSEHKISNDGTSWTNANGVISLVNTGTQKDGGYYWTSPVIEIANSTVSGVKTFKVSATDPAENEKTQTFNFMVDNVGPVISFISPDSKATQTGDVTIQGTATDASAISVLRYFVVTNDFADSDGVPNATTIKTAVKTDAYALQYNMGTEKMWGFPLDGLDYKPNDTVLTNTKLPSNATELQSYSKFHLGNDIYGIPICIYAEDELGNAALHTDYTLRYNPYSDRPVTQITYPVMEKVGNEYRIPVLAGTIRISGIAKDNYSVSDVFIQIDVDNNDEFEQADITALASMGYIVETKETLVEHNGYIEDKFEADNNFWGIHANGDASWYLSINENREFQTNGTNQKNIKVRAVAFDNNKLLGGWSDVLEIGINPSAPQISNSQVMTNPSYSDSTLSATSSVPYIAAMWVKGDVYLVAEILHSNGISEISYSVKNTFSDKTNVDSGVIRNTNNSSAVNKADLILKEGGANDKYIVKIPLSVTTGSGSRYVEIVAKDGTSEQKQSTSSYTLQYDNTAPTISDSKFNLNNSFAAKDNVLQNSEGSLAIKSTAADEHSGFKRAMFYFMRPANSGLSNPTKDRIYDVMLNDSHIDLTGADLVAKSLGVTEATQNVYGKEYTGVTRGSLTTLTISETNEHIRKGGLVEIGGTYHKITDVSGTSITFEGECATSYTEAFFPYAQVVDHTGEVPGKATDTGFGTIDGDDGDGMPENITQSGATWTWSANVISSLIPDGPIALVMFVFDNADNVSAICYEGSIQNNRPRIAKVHLGTDLNGNGKYAPNEFETYNILGEFKDAQGSVALTTGGYDHYQKTATGWEEQGVTGRNSFKIKSGLAVVPEFVGGNGEIKMVFDNTGSESHSKNDTLTLREIDDTNAINGSIGYNDNDNSSYNRRAYIISSGDIGADTTEKAMSFTFWDSTEEQVCGQTSQYAFLRVTDFVVAQTDRTAPNTVINKFHWKSKTDNSIYKEKVNGVEVLKGHIELEDDLPDAFTKDNTTDTLMDRDPKVSGKITMTGYAYDDTCLSAIYVSFGDINFGGGIDGGSQSGYTLAAKYANGSWNFVDKDNNTNMATNGWSFTVSDSEEDGAYFNQDGHKVNWTFSVDTEKISTVAAKDVKAKVIAVDKTGSNTTSTTADATPGDETLNTPTYQMDVVPYITSIWTDFSEYDRATPSLYARASTGEYPVRKGTTPVIYGWNLEGFTRLTVGGESVTGGTYATNVNTDVKDATGGITFTVPDEASGAVVVTVNSITTLNNENNNDARGGYSENTEPSAESLAINSNFYNMQPNGTNNNLLTDDVALDIWEFKNAAEPVGGAARYAHMKVGPKGEIGFSFKNGVGYFNMPGKKYSGGSGSSGPKYSDYANYYMKNFPSDSSIANYILNNGNDSKKTMDLSISGSGIYVYNYDNDRFEKEFDYPNSGTGIMLLVNDTSDLDGYTHIYVWSSSSSTNTGAWPGATLGTYFGSTKFSNYSGYATLVASQTSQTSDAIWSQTRFGTSYGGFNHNTFAYDKNSEVYGVAQCPDTSGKAGVSANLQFFSRAVAWERGDWKGLNSNYANMQNARRIESTSYVKGSNTYTDEERSQSPSMATYVNSGTTYVYLAYYDHGLDKIKFRIGSVGSTPNNIGYGLQDLLGVTGLAETNEESLGGDHYKIGVDASHALRDSTDTNYAGDKTNAYKYVTILNANNKTSSNTYGTSPYVATGVLPSNGTAVVVWYDGKAQKLMLAYNTFANMINATGITGNWNVQEISSNGGAHVAMAVDASDGIHLAYSSNKGADLYYGYIDGTSLSSSVSKTNLDILVDVYDNVGSYCSIDVGRKDASSPWIPYITYKRDASSISTKIAYPVKFNTVGASGKPIAGASSAGLFTGSWAICTVPCEYESATGEVISVGLHKAWYAGEGVVAGAIKNFSNKVANDTTSDVGVYGICNATKVYGNGTKNPVVGYAATNGNVVMAQKK